VILEPYQPVSGTADHNSDAGMRVDLVMSDHGSTDRYGAKQRR
jgi:hypothetical protein